MRSTHRGLLDGVWSDLRFKPQGDHYHEGMLSLVLDENGGQVRKLPSLYLYRNLIHTNREVDEVVHRAGYEVRTLIAAPEERIYRLQACRLGGRFGLYGRDFFSMNPFRRKIARLGVEFADEPYSRMTDEGDFLVDGWGTFNPRFLILPTGQDGELHQITGASLLVTLADYRLGIVEPTEFRTLAGLSKEIWAGGSADPKQLVDQLRLG